MLKTHLIAITGNMFRNLFQFYTEMDYVTKKGKGDDQIATICSVWFVSELRYVFTTNSIPVMGI